MKLKSFLLPREENPINKKQYNFIPKKIFQTWETNEVTPAMYDAVHTWIDKNPDWEYYFFDDKSCRDFIKEKFPKKVLDAYDTLIPGAYKADLWRYCVLYIHGGVYADIKQELLTGLNNVLPVDVQFLSIKERNKLGREFSVYIYQAFICAKPNHMFLKKAINMIAENVTSGNYCQDELSVTGPGLLGRAINMSVDRSVKSSHKVGRNLVKGTYYDLWPQLDRNNGLCVNGEGTSVFNLEYKNYRKELYSNISNSLEKNYVLSWYFGKVYSSGKINRASFGLYFGLLYQLKKLQKYFIYLRQGKFKVLSSKIKKSSINI